MSEDLVVRPDVILPGCELLESHSRSGGPGGQHVNTTSSRVTLRWNVPASSLPEEIKARILQRVARRLTREGDLVVHVDESRSQATNREIARKRLAAVVAAALVVPRTRRPTRPSRASQERRIGEKRTRSATKKTRGRVDPD